MTKRMLIDAAHEEETRVAVVDGNRLEEYDYESTNRKPLKGSIFLAKVTRVEPSLQAAFVNYGGNRHGFLPFSEIHPDYFRIPIADREALIAEQEALMEEQAKEEEEDDIVDDDGDAVVEDVESEVEAEADNESEAEDDDIGNLVDDEPEDADGNSKKADEKDEDGNNKDNRGRGGRGRRGGRGGRHGGRGMPNRGRRSGVVDDEMSPQERFRFNLRRKYKIQEVIKRGQIMLIQVSKEERGNKGAAVTSYLSLPGRYCVLMPNSPRAGGVSRKIANYKDRKKMREVLSELEIPKGMSVILRTAGVSRTKTEIKRDFDYLMRLWSTIREDTLQSSAPAMIYEEANLIKRSIRDIYSRDIDDVIVAGEEGYKTAKQFMKMLVPSHVKKVQLYDDQKAALFQRYQVESQISEIGEISVTLKSGGYLVINPTEALVSIDVNSGKATKERHIEETALKTNLEAAEELARQLRLRDLGGLVVVDFIDMEDRRNNGKVERKLRDALSGDRARIQVGRISNFGLLELSRQRLNPSLTEAQYEVCPHCKGSGNIRTTDATSIMVIRAIEEEGVKGRAAALIVHVSNSVALYILNNKSRHISEIEDKFNFSVSIRIDDDIAESDFRIEVAKPSSSGKDADDAEEEKDADEKSESKSENNKDENNEGGRSRRRGRRGGRRRGRGNRDNNQQSEGNADQNKDQAEDMPKADSEEKSDDKPKRGGRKPAAKKDDVKEDKKSEDKAEKSDSKKADDKPKKAAAKKAPAKKDKEENQPAANDEPAKVDSKSEKKAPAKKAAAKKDDKPAEYETVNEPPKKKKSGWWNKLVD